MIHTNSRDRAFLSHGGFLFHAIEMDSDSMMEVPMKAVVNLEGCISCGLCVSTCPEVFAFDEDGVAVANGQLNDSNYAAAESARSACPVAVIDIVD